jgi:hypothetical protein
VEYQIDWGDGTQSVWDSSSQSHSYSSSGTKTIKAHARCQIHTGVISDWSNTSSVSISYCTLTINVNPSGSGSVSKNPDKTDFSYNETVQLTANAYSGYQFDHWGGDLNGSDNPQNLNINSDKNVTAYFNNSTNVEIVSNSTEIVKDFGLEQNFPNPFNPETTIRFKLPKSCYVTLKIFNLSGQVIETLINGYQTTGIYDVKWRPKGLANGIYLYILQADEFTKIQKLILQK